MKGQSVTSDETTVEAEVELLDSDIIALEGVIEALNQSRLKPTTVDGWRREIEDRFSDVGFKVSIVIRQAEYVEYPDGSTKQSSGGQIFTSVTIVDRIEPQGEFDHERMGHEVRSNIRGLPGQENVQTKPVAMGGASMKKSDSGLYVPGN